MAIREERLSHHLGNRGRRLHAALPFAAAVALLAACGGGSSGDQPVSLASTALPAQEATRERPLATKNVITPTALMSWAETAYAQYFPSKQTDQVFSPYIYRYYPETQNYLAVNGNAVQVLGPVSGGTILTVGVLEDFRCSVFPADCPLLGRAWSAGQLLETDDNTVDYPAFGIDDAGRATVVFLKSNGSRQVLYATRGSPNGAGIAPSWTRPVVIDLQGTTPVGVASINGYNFSLAVAPNGNALAYWIGTDACNANTYATGGKCNFLYAARMLAATGAWEQPVRVVDVPSISASARINSNGDVAALVTGWLRSGTSGYKSWPAVVWRANGGSTFQKQTFSDTTLGDKLFDFDNNGNMLLAAEANQNSTVDIVAIRGSLSSGFGSPRTLDLRGSEASLRYAAVGINGQQVVMWSQNNGSSTSMYAAASASATGDFAVKDLGLGGPQGNAWLTVTDEGEAGYYDLYSRRRILWSAGTWQAVEAMPSAVPNSSFLACSHSRSGDFLCLQNSAYGTDPGGIWATYDASRNAMVQSKSSKSSAGFVLGLDSSNRSVGLSNPVLSMSGVALVTLRNQYDVLPSSAAPSGDGRNVTNLWGAFLK